MTRSRFFGLAVLTWIALTGAALAEDPKPTMTAVISSREAVLANLKAVMVDMAEAPAQFTTLKETVDVLLEGTEQAGSLSYRAYLRGQELREVYTLPVADRTQLKFFLQSIKDMGYTTRTDPSQAKGEFLYRMSNLDTGSIRWDESRKMLHIVPLGNTSNKALQDDSRRLARAVTTAAPRDLLKGRDVLLLIENSSGGLEDRKAAFGKLTENINKSIETKNVKETAAEHALRVAATKHQMSELERFFVEASRIVVGSTTVASKGKGMSGLDIELAALPETALAKSVDQLGKTPDEFAGIGREGAIVWINANLPVDTLRKGHISDTIKLVLPVLHQRIDANAELDAAEKQTHKDLGEMGTEAVADMAESGLFNGFVRVYRNGDKSYTSVGATKVPNGKKYLDILEKMKDRKGSLVKMNVDKVGEVALGAGTMPAVAIHSVSAPQLAKTYPEFFGGDGLIYVGTSDTTVWSACGTDALNVLKKAIEEAAQTGPQVSKLLIDANVAVLQWVEAWDRRQGRKGEVGIRKALIEGLKGGKDVTSVQLWQDEKDAGTVRLSIKFEEGMLRAAGKVSAKVVRDNLE